jgi:hypothetical protein
MLKVGIPNNIVRWIHNFINNRFISVVQKANTVGNADLRAE